MSTTSFLVRPHPIEADFMRKSTRSCSSDVERTVGAPGCGTMEGCCGGQWPSLHLPRHKVPLVSTGRSG